MTIPNTDVNQKAFGLWTDMTPPCLLNCQSKYDLVFVCVREKKADVRIWRFWTQIDDLNEECSS